MDKEITGTLHNGARTRLGHVLAHLHNRADIFSSLGTAIDDAVQSIHKIRGISQEMDTQEVNIIYEPITEYHLSYPLKSNDINESVFRWTTIFQILIRDAAVYYTYMAARTEELDEALEYASFASDLWAVLINLKRGLAVEQLRDQISRVIDGV